VVWCRACCDGCVASRTVAATCVRFAVVRAVTCVDSALLGALRHSCWGNVCGCIAWAACNPAQSACCCTDVWVREKRRIDVCNARAVVRRRLQCHMPWPHAHAASNNLCMHRDASKQHAPPQTGVQGVTFDCRPACQPGARTTVTLGARA
jgi:hypothetical protein